MAMHEYVDLNDAFTYTTCLGYRMSALPQYA